MQLSVLMSWLLSIASASVFVATDSLSAFWGKNGSHSAFLAIILLSPFGYILFGLLNKHLTLAVSSSVVNTLIILGNVLVGIIYFKESINQLQIVGVLLAIVSIVILQWPR